MSKLTACILLVLCLMLTMVFEVRAEELELDMNVIDSYISDIDRFEFDFDTLVDCIQAGDIKSFASNLKNEIYQALKSNIVDRNKIMYTIIAICLFSVILRSSTYDKQRNIFGQILVCSGALILLQLYSELYMMAKNVIHNLTGFMNVSLPVYFAISASLAEKLPFSVYGVFTAFVTLFHYGTVHFVLPAITIASMLGISENLCPHFDTSAIRKYINTSVNWLLGLYTTFFVAVLKLSQIGAYGTDKLVMSGIRYTLSHSIPVVGGFLSEIAGSVITSTLILHNAVGLGCVIVISMIALVPFLMIFTISFILRLIASLMSGVAYKELCNIIMCFGECLCELSVIMLCGCVTFIIGIGIQLSVGR